MIFTVLMESVQPNLRCCGAAFYKLKNLTGEKVVSNSQDSKIPPTGQSLRKPGEVPNLAYQFQRKQHARKRHLPKLIHFLYYIEHIWGINEIDTFCTFYEFVWNAV